MKQMKWTRRAWLRGFGLAAAALAAPGPSIGRADPPRRPIRLACIVTPSGTIRSRWGRRRSDADFELREILQPFAALRDEIVVLSGIDMAVCRLGHDGGHQRGPCGLLTGWNLLPGDFCGGLDCAHGRTGWAAGPSIDQVIAGSSEGRTRLRSLELGVRLIGSNNRHRIAFRAANEPVPPDNDPFHVYQRIFADAGVDRVVLERLRRERASVLDLVGEELRALGRWMPAEGRPRLDAHLTSIRDAERQLDAAANGLACEAPAIGERFDPMASSNYEAVSRLQLELTALAFACDATRVTTLFYSGATSLQTFPWLRVQEQHHPLSHAPDSNRDAQEKLTRINAWYAGEVARFAERLAAIPEGEGTLLDHTIVFFGNELSKGNSHSHDDMRFLIAGGRAAGVRGGRWLWCDHRPHNDLLVSFGRAMGLADLERFGHPDFCTGPLTELGIP